MKAIEFATYGSHIDEGMRGTLVMRGKATPEERALLVFPMTFCPNQSTTLSESNWFTLQAELEKVDPEGNDHQTVQFGHWVTPYDLMLVKAGTEAHRVALELAARLEGHPVLDEDDLSNREQAAFDEALESEIHGLTIEVNGVEAKKTGREHDAVYCAVSEYLTRRETPESVDASDVTRALTHLGFTYDADDFTWRGALDLPSTVPNLDCMVDSELEAFHARYQRPTRADAAALIGDRRRGYIGLAKSLAAYANNKATAQQCRLRGDIQGASIYETICDGIYDRLPEDLRW